MNLDYQYRDRVPVPRAALQRKVAPQTNV
jgi:hypothetical protein